MRSTHRWEQQLSTDPPAPPRSYAWADHITACLFALAALAGGIRVIEGLTVPEQGIVSGLEIIRGGGTSSCTTIGRVTSCRNDVDLNDLNVDDPFSSGFGIEDLECHQVQFRTPNSWRTGKDCVAEEEWLELEIGDWYSPTSG